MLIDYYATRAVCRYFFSANWKNSRLVDTPVAWETLKELSCVLIGVLLIWTISQALTRAMCKLQEGYLSISASLPSSDGAKLIQEQSGRVTKFYNTVSCWNCFLCTPWTSPRTGMFWTLGTHQSQRHMKHDNLHRVVWLFTINTWYFFPVDCKLSDMKTSAG